MSNKSTWVLSAILILAALLAGVLLWNQMPEQMASHWNEHDQVNGYISRFWGLYLVPLMMVGLTLLFLAIPSIDPLKANIKEFRGIFNIFIVLFNAYMLYVHALTLAWNLGHTGFSMGAMMMPAVGLLFILIGLGIRKAKRNYFIGIRTPWTLSSDIVWEKTHRLGSWLFVGAGALTFLGIAFPQQTLAILMISILGAALITVVYSYIIFKQEEKKNS